MIAAGPLSDYRVLELGSTAAGPFCTRLLADFGADVVKIEAAEGDPIRQLGETVAGKSLYGASIMRNKRIASFNFRKPEARALVKRLIPKFDIVVENFRPGTLEKWGLGYEDLSALKPGLVMTRISGYGQSGPYRDQPGYGVISEAMSGLRHMTGDPDRPPSRVGIPLTDYITAVYAAFGTVMAVLHREKTGTGQCVDAALIESAFSFMEAFVPAYEKTGKIGMRNGPRLADSAPNTLFPTRDGSHIHIAALADTVFRRLAVAIGKPELGADPRFAEQKARSANEALIESIVGSGPRARPRRDRSDPEEGRRAGEPHLRHGGHLPRPALPGARHAGAHARRRPGQRDPGRGGAAPVRHAGVPALVRPPHRAGHARLPQGHRRPLRRGDRPPRRRRHRLLRPEIRSREE
jgi:crotonobetainyl-CoA:carnitine CoA-transferase CaiB-like acyl-CoA transferase